MEQEELKKIASYIEGFCPEEACARLYSLAKESEAEGAILDIGSFKGRTTICFAKAQAETKDGKVYAIEVNFFHTKEELLKNIADFKVKDWVIPIFSHSAQANKRWERLPIKLIFMDTDGNYFSAVCDFLLWERYLVKGGVIALACADNSGIRRLVNDYIINSQRFRDITTVGSIVFAYKTKDSPYYSAWKISYIRILYLTYFRLRKIFHALIRLISPRLGEEKSALKKIINKFFEGLVGGIR